MFKALAFGIGFGAAVQAWRNFPADGPVSSDMLAFILVVGLGAAFMAGRSRRPSAYASATATATAVASAAAENHATVNVINVVPGQGASPAGVRIPGEDVAWMVGNRETLSLDQLDGMDLAEFCEDSDERERA